MTHDESQFLLSYQGFSVTSSATPSAVVLDPMLVNVERGRRSKVAHGIYEIEHSTDSPSWPMPSKMLAATTPISSTTAASKVSMSAAAGRLT